MKILFWSFLVISLMNPFALSPNDVSEQTAEVVPAESAVTHLPALPHFDVDLVVGSIQIDLGECQMEHETFSWTVSFCNNGTGPARPCQMAIWVSTNPTNPAYYEFSMPSIAAQSCLNYSGTGVRQANHVLIYAVADIYDVVIETDEFNNSRSHTEVCP